MFTHIAKTRVPTHSSAANARLFTSHHSSTKLAACAVTKYTGFPARRIGQVCRIASFAMFTSVSYGNRHSHSVRNGPSAASLLGSPGWSAKRWCSRCRFTHVIGLMYTPNVLFTTDRTWTNQSL